MCKRSIDFGIDGTHSKISRNCFVAHGGSRTYTATLEPGKTHVLAVAALRRQPCRLPQSCARTDYVDKYAVSIRSILTLPKSTYFSSLTSFSFLGDVFYVSCRFSAFPLPPSASYRRKHETAQKWRKLFSTGGAPSSGNKHEAGNFISARPSRPRL